MDVRQAARTAKEYVVDLFAGEEITDVGLEEVVFDDISNYWEITIGFSRPWDHKGGLITALGDGRFGRSYKVIRIDDDDGHVVSMTDRILADSQS